MAISVPATTATGITSYSGLQTFLIAHLELDSETQGQIATLIRMAESRLDRMLTTPAKETSATTATVSGTAFVSLPSYVRSVRTVKIDDDYPLEPVSLNVLQSYTESTGKPEVYCISEQELWLSPTPDAAYSVRFTYETRLEPLSSTNTSNWLLEDHQDAYVYACIAQIESFLDNDERAARYWNLTNEIIEEINRAGNRYRVIAPVRLRSPVVV